MDPLTSSASNILGRYASLNRSELIREVGPEALDVTEEMFKVILNRLRQDPAAGIIADEFEKSPEIYQKPVEKIIDNMVEADPQFAAKLKNLCDRYNKTIKKHADSEEQSHQADLSGTGSVAQGEGATAVTATKSGVAIGSVRGDVTFEGNRHIDTETYVENVVEKVSPKMAQNIAEIRYQHELDRIDSEWKKEREKYTTVDEHGRKIVPTKGNSIVGSIFFAVISFFISTWLIIEFLYTDRTEVVFIPVIISPIVGLKTYKYLSRAARQYSEAEKAYLDRRNQIKRSDFEEDKND